MAIFSIYSSTTTLIICVIAVLFGVFLGNGAVVFFNRLPGQWFLDYDENPEDEKYHELMHPTCQRVKSTPWKYIFTGLFIVTGIYLGVQGYEYAVPAILAIWLLLLMSVSDIKYMIVPDQFIMLLLVTGIGFISIESGSIRQNILQSLYGLGLGLGLLLIMALLSKLIYRTPGIGGADIKLYAVLGFLTGTKGVISIFILTTFLSALHFIYLMIMKKATLKEQKPMIPYVAVSGYIYFVFLHQLEISWLL